MRWNEIAAVDEAFEHKDIAWTRESDRHVARYEVNLQEFQGHFVQSDASLDVWEYAFMAIKSNGEPSIENTGEQGSKGLEVFSYAVSSIEQFLADQSPAYLRFSGDKSMGKANLYEKMARRLKPRATALGYRIAVEELDHERTFIFEKND